MVAFEENLDTGDVAQEGGQFLGRAARLGLAQALSLKGPGDAQGLLSLLVRDLAGHQGLGLKNAEDHPD